MGISYVVDSEFGVRGLRLWDGWTIPVKICKAKLHLPYTLMNEKELVKIYDIAKNGPGKGSIVQIGQFQGGSTVVLAKGSKNSKREKVFSFDPVQFPWTEEIFEKNKVNDWIVFSKTLSQNSISHWKQRSDSRVRILFIDGDHSYEGCKRDILQWSPYLVKGGFICIHDYVEPGIAWEPHRLIAQAVHDTILRSGKFNNFQRVETLFLAQKI